MSTASQQLVQFESPVSLLFQWLPRYQYDIHITDIRYRIIKVGQLMNFLAINAYMSLRVLHGSGPVGVGQSEEAVVLRVYIHYHARSSLHLLDLLH